MADRVSISLLIFFCRRDCYRLASKYWWATEPCSANFGEIPRGSLEHLTIGDWAHMIVKWHIGDKPPSFSLCSNWTEITTSPLLRFAEDADVARDASSASEMLSGSAFLTVRLRVLSGEIVLCRRMRVFQIVADAVSNLNSILNEHRDRALMEWTEYVLFDEAQGHKQFKDLLAIGQHGVDVLVVKRVQRRMGRAWVRPFQGQQDHRAPLWP